MKAKDNRQDLVPLMSDEPLPFDELKDSGITMYFEPPDFTKDELHDIIARKFDESRRRGKAKL